MSLSTTSLRSILDSIATRLDEQRDTSRYLVGLLVFLDIALSFAILVGAFLSCAREQEQQRRQSWRCQLHRCHPYRRWHFHY